MNRTSHFLTLMIALVCGITFAQDKSKIDWKAEYKKLLASDPGVRQKIERGQATKEDVIRWLQETRSKKTESAGNKKRDLSAFRKKLSELVEAGKLSKEDAAKLAATMGLKETAQEEVKRQDSVDWDAEYEKLLKKPAIRQKIEQSGATKEQVIECVFGLGLPPSPGPSWGMLFRVTSLDAVEPGSGACARYGWGRGREPPPEDPPAEDPAP